ncbi:SCO2525 family SAM-dependent methyltransferase [Kitasatospora sp. NBC_01266]|uniref:SCO2525 family SAM-dependent methyltransferase n=1 Tax=Kitasatospora sp. NBC_01266 TaxID=2903572 RepID=UPI002E381D2E|nr:SCO2525 family SAM-dependent methyltransferase [Kitasatospora sp. NBC_01266]
MPSGPVKVADIARDSVRNSEAPWDSFNALEYLNENYLRLQQEDRLILTAVRDHFGAHFQRHGGGGLRGLDVGAGTNLYPSLAMLPWCSRITLFERAPGNVAWLRGEVAGYGRNWDAFWRLLAEHPAYQGIDDPRALLSGAAEVVQGDLFAQLPERGADVGTMFFVAESLSTEREEFVKAVNVFVRALRPGAPFAVAFMENSDGSDVGELHFPACRIVTNDVVDCLRGHAADGLQVNRIEIPGELKLRDGPTCMLLALGQIR